MNYKEFMVLPHTADLKIRVFGNSKQELFENALSAMFACIKPKYAKDSESLEFEICIDAPDIESLLVDFLSEALYLSDANNCAFTNIRIKEFSDNKIGGFLIGSKISGFEVVEIKAVTYHDLKIRRVGDIWQTEIVFDI